MKIRLESRQVILKKIADLIAELNQKRVELENIKEQKSNIEIELKGKQNLLVLVVNDLERNKNELKSINDQITNKSFLFDSFKKEIPIKHEELNKLKNEIDLQIKLNKEKEEKVLKGLKEQQEIIKNNLNEIYEEIKDEIEKKNILLKENQKFDNRLEENKKELEKVSLKISTELENIKKENELLNGRMAMANKREKQLNFYNDRLQRYAQKLNIQLKEI